MRQRILRGALGALALAMLLTLSLGTVAAQTPTAAPVTGGQTFSGTITKTNPLTVNSSGQDRQVNATANTAIVRDGKAATVGDLKVGDQVNVTSNPDNTVSRIETTSVASGGLPGWLIPLLIALLILGLILFLLARRKKEPFVLERDRPTTTPRA